MANQRKLFTFDIYDTVVSRVTSSPYEVFTDVGSQLIHEGLWNKSSIDFAAERSLAEKISRHKKAETTFESIIDVMILRLGSRVATRASSIELECELALSVGVKENIELIISLQENNEQICYISDMYHNESFLEQVLAKVGAPILEIYVSSKYKMTKINSNLFRFVSNKYSAGYHYMHHIGDNKLSDYHVPRRLGINASLYSRGGNSALENRLFDNSSKLNSKYLNKLAREIKKRRLSANPEALENVGAQIGSILQVGFISWLISRIIHNGNDVVYFLSRDGFTPYCLYKEAQKQIPSLPKAKYLLVSRQSLSFPFAAHDVQIKNLEWIFDYTHGLTYENWLSRLSLEPDDMNHFPMISPGFLASRILDKEDLQVLKSLFIDDDFMEMLKSRSLLKKSAALSYFSEQGLFDASRPAIVDIGWKGRMQSSICTVCSDYLDPSCLDGYYFGLADYPSGNYGNYEAFIFNIPKGLNPWLSRGSNLVEIIFSAPHNTVTGYRLNPLTREVEISLSKHNPLADHEPSLHKMRLAIIGVYNCVDAQSLSSQYLMDSIRAICAEELFEFVQFPSYGYAAAFSNLLFSEDIGDSGKEPIFSRTSFVDAALCALKIKQRPTKNQWIFGQLAFHAKTKPILVKSVFMFIWLAILVRSVTIFRYEYFIFIFKRFSAI